MTKLTLPDLSERMRDIDFAMLSTRTANGKIAARPMSNNRDVAYEGDSYFFTWETSRMVQDIEGEKHVGLSMTGSKSLFGKPPIFIAVEGAAELIRDKAAFAEHWQPELERWFKEGIDTPQLVLIKVNADRVHYWDGEEEGEITLRDVES